ncbi:hypothetical protein [Klebsiella aerogenes]|uniref:hypothetical protein n=1 Tax=Klebsiella aerogenes TaxID=548 RepID=UPI002279393C|nr:hypothetical protein [Klebsiella aerogenes]MCY4765901.1 hypothetical protein [Klebsiella aerogenes]
MHNRSVSFIANVINCYTEYDVPIIGIADAPLEPQQYIIISQFIDDDESTGESIGLQTHLAEQEISAAIDKIYLSRDLLTVMICPDRIAEVGTACVKIDLTKNGAQWLQLQKYLHLIFAGSKTLVELAL